MDIITGYTGTPHITSQQDREINQGIIGAGSYILNLGNNLSCDIISANEVHIKDGILSLQGCAASIAAGTYDSLSIDNGSQGMNRTDLIVARYTKDSGTNVEDVSLVVITGTPTAGQPSAPAYTSGNIRSGDTTVDFPLYEVNISGISLDSVTLVATVVDPLSAISATLDTLSATTADTGTASNTYADVSYEYKKVGKVVLFTYTCTPKSAISGSTGGISLTGVPSPVSDVYGSTHTNSSGSTVYGPGRLISGATPQIVLYGQRASGTAYHGSFTYLTA